ncbi:type 1 fimbrial protein, partial [Escherichia coli]|uniref:fimbrial protein n=1 Tax=Escherichia coli TaxID=562 RepID=UPI001E355423
MKYNNIIFLGLCLGLTTYSALSADSVIKISGRVLDYGCTVSSDSLNFTVDLQKNSARQFPTTGSTSPAVPFQIWICPYISRHLLSLNPLLACCRRYSRG